MRLPPPPSTFAGLLPIRLAIALVFLMHGGQKIFTFGLSGVTGMLTGMGVPLPSVAAVLLIAVECLGGLALLVGIGVRWAALLLVGDMAGAILLAKLKGGFFAPQGVEFELVLLAGALTLALLGTGRRADA